MKIYLILILMVLSGIVYSKDKSNPLAAYQKDGLWYFLDESGKQIFEPVIAENVLGYSEGIFRIQIKEDGKLLWAFMDLKGKIIGKYDCDFAFNYSDGYALLFKVIGNDENNKKYAFIDKKGKFLYDFIYDDATDFNEGLAFFMLGNSRGYMNTKGETVIPLQNLAGNPFKEGLADVNTMDFKIGFINKKGEKVIDYQFDETGGFSEGLAFVSIEGKFSYIDKTGKIVITQKFDYANHFKEGFAFVAKSDDNYKPKWGFINREGTMISDYQFDKAQDFSEGKSAVLKNKRWGFINYEGKFLIEAKYYYCDSFVNGLAWISDRENEKYGYINHKEEMVIPIPKAEKLFDFRVNRIIYQ